MKYLILPLMIVSTTVVADHRIDADWCHFVKPTGIAAGNNGDEVKASQCPGDIITNSNGTRVGSVVEKRKYAPGTTPIGADYTYTSDPNITNIVCNLDDGNNTYQTKDWTVTYKVEVENLDDFKDAFGTVEGDRKYDEDFDLNEDGVINFADLTLFRAMAKGEVKYELACRNAVQQ